MLNDTCTWRLHAMQFIIVLLYYCMQFIIVLLCFLYTYSFKSDKVLAPKIESRDSIACSNLLQILSWYINNAHIYMYILYMYMYNYYRSTQIIYLVIYIFSNAHNSAYERQSEACSVFNKALRSGLEKKLNVVSELGGHILVG